MRKVGWFRVGFLAFGLVAFAAVAQDDASTDAAAEQPFDVYEYRVLGNTVLSAREIEATVYPLLGPSKRLADVEKARDALVATYRKAGFGTVLVDIPEQSVDDGVVRLQVTEGKVGRVEVRGARYFSTREIKDTLPAVQPGSVPKLPEFQAQLAQLGRATPDRRVTPVLKAGRAPGQVDVVLNVDDNVPFHASVEVNDRSTADTSRTRASGTIGYDYLFGRPQSLSLQYQTAPEAPNEVQVLALTWVKRLPESGGAWAVYAIDSKSDVAAVGTLNVLGNGRIFGFRRILPGPSSAAAGIGVSLGADFKDFKEDIRLPKDVSSVTPVRYLVSSAAVNGYLRKGAWALDAGATLSMGLRGLVNREEDFAYKRAYGHAQFAYLRANGAVAYTLPKDFRVALRLAGQYSPQPLISNEQFSMGGADTVRGYLEAEALVDRGAVATIEVGTPAWKLFDWGRDAYALRAALFAEGGIGYLERPLPSQEARFDLASYGVGFTFGGGRGLEAKLDWARTLLPGSRTPEGDSRIHFSFKTGF
jgi:hemolysin activation/secretion protein